MKRIVFTVTNDLNYDQRMRRICSSLANESYQVLLVGRKLKTSIALKEEIFKQKRLHCLFTKGFLFYAEYNFRLFFYLLFIKMDAICAVDLDTILPCFFVSVLRRKNRIYDAHELFTEMKEIITRPAVKSVWIHIEKFAVPKFKFGYTVSYSIAKEFKNRYNVLYEVIRNMPVLKHDMNIIAKEKNILYQGAVNEARGLENLVAAMHNIDAVLNIYGDGNLLEKIKDLVQENNLQHKILLKGKVAPDQLNAITLQSYIGINLVEPVGLNQVYSLANKFFDYVHAGVPQVTMNFPEYKKINDEFEVAVLVNTVDETEIASAINLLLRNADLYSRLQQNCKEARALLNWQHEEKKLISFYKSVFSG